ncbi:MAG: hypothetical protein SX243_25755 [Acidobacteriota bacterium]|nr:hypothetical protein [Acidobacteriota bacterium]
MAELEAARYVRIMCGQEFLGSGFRLSPTVVLTCWHVVYGYLEGLQVQDPDGDGWQSNPAKVVWPHPPPAAKEYDGPDAVLLETDPQGSLSSWRRYQKASILAEGRWSGAGYVSSEKKPEERLPLGGGFHLVDEAEGGFTVSMKSGKPKKAGGWKGISGSPILTRTGGSGGLALVGLLRSAVHVFEGTYVKAVSVPSLFRADGFEEALGLNQKEALGLNKEDERWTRLREGVENHMDQQVCARLRQTLGTGSDTTGGGPTDQELIDLVCGGRQLVDIATALLRAYGDDSAKSAPELRSRIKTLVDYALPASFWQRLGPEVPHSAATRVRIRLLVRDLVEVACAAIDGRSLRLEASSVNPSRIRAPLQVSLPPESGADLSGEQGARDVTGQLVNRMALSGAWADRPEERRQALLFLAEAVPRAGDHLFHSSLILDLDGVPEMNPGKWEEVFLRILNSRIRAEASRNLRYYIVADPDQLRDAGSDVGHEAVFRSLAQILPELRQVILEPDLEEVADENETRNALVKIFGKRTSKEDDS